MTDKEPIVYKFTPHNEGDHIKGIPPRDLTQSDVDRIHPFVRNDAFQPHPLHGTPLYTAVGDDGKQPKWYLAKLEKIAARGDGSILPAMNPGETQKEYEARVDEDGVATLVSDGQPANDLGTPIDATDGDSGPDKEGD